MSIILSKLRKLFGILFSIIGLVRTILNKIICRTKRFRRDSGTLLPMTKDQISADVPLSVPSNDMNEVAFEPWDSWGGDAQTDTSKKHRGHSNPYQSKIEEYRSKQQQMMLESEPQDPDYFEAMLPDFKKAKKVLVRSKQQEDRNSTHTHSNKFAVTNFIPPQTNDLGQWEESEPGEGAWENEAAEDLSWEAEAAIRETKLLEREKRQAEQQRKKLEREAHKGLRKDGLTAVKIS